MSEKIVTCPKCGLDQPEADECRRCGVIFARIGRTKPAPAAAAALARKPAQKKHSGFYRALRITILLLIFFGLLINIYLTRWRIAEWNRSLWVVIHPICADSSPETRSYVDSLSAEEFMSVPEFFSAEAQRYGLKIREPFTFVLAPRLDMLPPQIPREPTALSMMGWSLQLRYWAWRIKAKAPVQDIQLFVLYHDKSRTIVDNSFVMQKGYIGIVNAYAASKLKEKNSVVMAHELLHLAGATDKYDPVTELPLYPDGYAEPNAAARYPQTHAEIMAGSIPVSESKSDMPESLLQTVIGPATAHEINWVQ